MPAGLRVWDEAGSLILDTNDRIVGGLVQFSTGQESGSYTATPDDGQSVEFSYFLPDIWVPSGRASRWPSFGRSGNTLTWVFTSGVPVSERVAVNVIVVKF